MHLSGRDVHRWSLPAVGEAVILRNPQATVFGSFLYPLGPALNVQIPRMSFCPPIGWAFLESGVSFDVHMLWFP
jgi:hypothetical protein